MRVNRYPGRCAECDGPVAARAGVLERRGRRWTVKHLACADAGAPAVDTFVLDPYGAARTFTRNRRGTCEDAPCCGCCTI